MINSELINIKIKNSNVNTILEVIEYFYKLVDSGTIKKFEITKIKKGKHSVESDIGLILSGATFAYPFLRDLVIKCKEKWSKSEYISYNMKLNNEPVANFGYGYRPIDTIVCSARPDTMKKIFHERHQWGEVAVAQNKFGILENIAMYETSVRAIRYIAKIDDIISSHNRKGFVTLFLDGEPIILPHSIPYSNLHPNYNARSLFYTTKTRLLKAETLRDVYC